MRSRVALPWLAQGVSTATLLLIPSPGVRAAGGIAALAVVTVVATVVAAVPAHGRLVAAPGPADVTLLLRANLVRTVAWTGSTVLVAAPSATPSASDRARTYYREVERVGS